ncbi:MAG: AmmeMemoRadiSam system protein A [Gammaproteobacteria bacterium]|nr:AmmeMemoRadiSam system protein A [Gammaproteobacteria bacterium]MCF6231443.1 AmmeMemoRadiSam system protein A [Gammaproteobacteria bacterium]
MSYNKQPLEGQAKQQLLSLARESITCGLQRHQPATVKLDDYPAALQQRGASFVTLEKQGMLRGCIGTLEAYRPLAIDVAENAFAAAFRDPRFPPVQADELSDLQLHISLLTPPEPLPVKDQAELLRRLQPGIDGLILHEGNLRATFLPSVWESLPEPRQFLAQLKLKAGLPADYWSETLHFERYKTISIDPPNPDIS